MFGTISYLPQVNKNTINWDTKSILNKTQLGNIVDFNFCWINLIEIVQYFGSQNDFVVSIVK